MDWKTALENVLLPVGVHRRRHRADIVEAMRLLALFGLEGFEFRFPQQLSGGMQQRVALASLLMTGASVRLLDEPFGAVDELTREHLNLELLKIHEQDISTTVLVTHNIFEAVLLSDRIVVMTPRPGTVAASIPSRCRDHGRGRCCAARVPGDRRRCPAPSRPARRPRGRSLVTPDQVSTTTPASGRWRGSGRARYVAPIVFFFVVIFALGSRLPAGMGQRADPPRPGDVAISTYELFETGLIWEHLWATLFETFAGFAVAASWRSPWPSPQAGRRCSGT